jgi:hypothetical protein
MATKSGGKHNISLRDVPANGGFTLTSNMPMTATIAEPSYKVDQLTGSALHHATRHHSCDEMISEGGDAGEV